MAGHGRRDVSGTKLFEEIRGSILVELFRNKSMTLAEFKNGRATNYRHLKDLCKRGFVKKERKKEFVHWSLNDDSSLIWSLKSIFCDDNLQLSHEMIFKEFFSRRFKTNPHFTTKDMRNFYDQSEQNPPSNVHMSNLFSKFIKEGLLERTGQRGGFLVIDRHEK